MSALAKEVDELSSEESETTSESQQQQPSTHQVGALTHKSHYNGEPSPLGAIQVPDDKLDCFGLKRKIFIHTNGLAFNPGPVLRPRADGSPLKKSVQIVQ